MNQNDASQSSERDDELADVAAGRSEVFTPFGHSPVHTPETMAEVGPDTASTLGYAEPTRDWSSPDRTVTNAAPQNQQTIEQGLTDWLSSQTSDLLAPQDGSSQIVSNASNFIDTDSASASDATAADDSVT